MIFFKGKISVDLLTNGKRKMVFPRRKVYCGHLWLHVAEVGCSEPKYCISLVEKFLMD
jgi:hypothetical protein